MRAVQLVEHDPAWAAAFGTLRELAVDRLGELVVDVHHVGSTAIATLVAKPKVDIDVVLTSTAVIEEAARRLASHAYECHGDAYGDGIWCLTKSHGAYGERLYLCGPGHPVHLARVRFRDYLSTHPDAAAAYGALKRRLAEAAGGDWERYTRGRPPSSRRYWPPDAKRPFMGEGALTIRRARREDAAELAAAERAIARVPGKLASRPDEIVNEALAALIHDLAEDGGIYLVAERAGAIVGHAYLESLPLAATSHVVRLLLAVHEGHQLQGVGRALMNELLGWARSNPKVEKIELQVRASNEPAVALYRSLGFVEEGRKTRRLKLGPNEYVDDIYMALWVGPFPSS